MPGLLPSRHEPTVAIPFASVATEVAPTTPPPAVTANATRTPGIGTTPDESATQTVGALTTSAPGWANAESGLAAISRVARGKERPGSLVATPGRSQLATSNGHTQAANPSPHRNDRMALMSRSLLSHLTGSTRPTNPRRDCWRRETTPCG